MVRLSLKHRRPTRWFHWLNFGVLALMIWSGLLIYWANDVYRIGVGDWDLVEFFPERFYELLNIDHRLAEGMAMHFAVMWFFVLNGVAYVAYTVWSGAWRQLVPGRHALRDAVRVTLHDLHLRKELPPQGKYNAAQQLAYVGVVGFGAGSILTGFAIYKPIQLGWLTALLGGYEWARAGHFILAMGYVAFFVVHVTQVARAGWNNLRSMIAGYEIVRNGSSRR
jgi:thiosulfate reductase cytochrome b subunit